MLKLIGYVIVILVFWETFTVAVSLNPHCRIPEQWGSVQGGNNWDVHYNIVFTNNVFVVFAWDFAAGGSSTMQFVGTNFQQSNKNTFHLYTSNAGGIGLGYVAIGY